MRTILIIWEHGANLGHLGRLLPIAGRLSELGWRVEFVVADVPAAERHLTPLGYCWHRAPQPCRSADSDGPALNHADVLLRIAFDRPVQDLQSVIRAWQHLISRSRAEAVLVDGSPLALYAARQAQVTVVALGHGFEIAPQRSPGPCFAPWVPDAQARCARLEEKLDRAFEVLGRELGSGAPRTQAELFEPGTSAICAWPEVDHFERPPADLPQYVGPVWSYMPGKRLDFRATLEGPRVLAYLNLVDKRHDLLWDALIRLGANVLVVSPGGNSKACAAVRGWGVEVIEEPVQLQPLLQQCAAVICHAGIGMCSMSLHAGKPLLLLPEHIEQGILANRLSKQWLALATVRLRDKEELRSKARSLLGAVTGAAASSFAQRHADYTPMRAVSNVVSRLRAL